MVAHPPGGLGASRRRYGEAIPGARFLRTRIARRLARQAPAYGTASRISTLVERPFGSE
jgi:hypothetical protein